MISGIIEDLDVGRIAGVGLQAPDVARCLLAGTVDEG